MNHFTPLGGVRRHDLGRFIKELNEARQACSTIMQALILFPLLAGLFAAIALKVAP